MATRRPAARPGPAPSGKGAGGGDRELVRDALAGEQRALEPFLERMRRVPRMLMARNMQLGTPLSESELEDVVQDALIALWRKLPGYDGTAALETWADRLGFFELLEHLRAQRRGPDLAWSELGRVEAGLARLGPTEAELVRGRHHEGRSFDELAKRLDLSPAGARKRYHEGMRRLREALGGPEPGDPTGSTGRLQHHDTHVDRLLELLAETGGGESAARAAFEASELAACDTCGELFAEYTALWSTLDRTGDELEKAAALAEGVHWRRGEDLVDEVLGRLARGGGPAAERRVPWLAVLGAVAAAVLLVQFFLYDPFASPSETYGATTLDGHGLEVLQPAGPVALWTSFRWTGQLPEGGWYTVRVGDREGDLLAESGPLRVPRWEPEAKLVVRWPAHIEWEVWLHDRSGKHTDTAFGEAWLSGD